MALMPFPRSEYRSVALAGPMGAGKTTLALELSRFGYTRVAFADALKELAVAFLGRPIEKARDRGLLQRLGDAGRDPAFGFVYQAMRAKGGSYADRDAAAAKLAAFLDDGTLFDTDAGPYVWFRAVQRLEEMLYDDGHAVGFGHPDYWVGRLRSRLIDRDELIVHDDGSVSRSAWRPVVIDDVRFPNEAEAVKAWGFLLLKMDTGAMVAADRARERDGERREEWSTHASERPLFLPGVQLAPGYGDVAENARYVAELARVNGPGLLA